MKNYRIQDQNATGEQSLFRGYLRVAFTENAVDSRCFKGIAENLEHKLTNSLHIHNKLINEKFFFIRNMEIINIITRNFDEWQQGKRMDMALVYTDIRSSTKTQASLGQDLYFHFIKKIQNMQIETVLKNKGYFDKFTGDGMLAAFGMFDQKDLVLNAHRALTCVADLLSALKDLNQTKLEHAQNLEEFKAENELMNKLRETKFAMGVGVHCGSGRMALIGQEKKHMELTVFGDVANVGQRYEAATKLESVNYPFVISEATCDLLYTRKDISLDAKLCNAFEEPGKTSVLKEQAMHGPLKCFKVKSFIDTNQQKRDILGLLDYIWPVQVAD